MPFEYDGDNILRKYCKVTKEEELTVPDDVEIIGANAFYACDNLRYVVLQEPLRKIERSAFYDCPALEHIEFPDTLTEIGEMAFHGCDLKKLRLPENLRCIGRGAFSLCDELTDVFIGKSLETIGDSAFGDCYALRNFHIHPENKVFSVRNGCLFQNNKLIFCPANTVDLCIPEGTESTCNTVFSMLPELLSVRFPSTLRECTFESDVRYRLEQCSLLELWFALPETEVYFMYGDRCIYMPDTVFQIMLMLVDFFYLCQNAYGRWDLFRRVAHLTSREYSAPAALYMVLYHPEEADRYADHLTTYLPEIADAAMQRQDEKLMLMLLKAGLPDAELTDRMLDCAIRAQAHTLTVQLLDYKKRRFGFPASDELL